MRFDSSLRSRSGLASPRRAAIALACLMALPAASVPAWAGPQDGGASAKKPTPQTGLRGNVVREDGSVAYGVIVRVQNLGSSMETSSAPTGPSGNFEIDGLEHGYYDILVETDAGEFVGNRVVNVPPGGFGVILLRLGPVRGEIDNSAYGTRASAGMASVERKLNKREFWRSPKGVGILAGVGGVALLSLAASDESTNRFASPILP